MNILFDIVENTTYLMHPKDNTDLKDGDGFKFGTEDIRGCIMIRICQHLLHRGHNVIVRNCISDKWHMQPTGVRTLAKSGAEVLEWFAEERQDQILDDVDLYITCGFMTSRGGKNRDVRTKVENQTGGRKAIIKYYDIGWLPDTVWMDREKLFGESAFCDDLDKLAEEIYDRNQSEKYRAEVIGGGMLTSKRPQPSAKKTQQLIDSRRMRGKYIYMPAQKIKDGSITGIGFGLPKQSPNDVLETLEQVADAACPHGVAVVVKPHPHWQCSWKDTPRIKSLADNLSKKWKHKWDGPGTIIKILQGNTQTFMRNAMFSTTICSASIVDALITQTPIYYTGKTMFYKSKSVVYDPDISSGIDNMITGKYDKKEVKTYQSMILHYLNKKSMHKKFHSSENYRRFINQIGINL